MNQINSDFIIPESFFFTFQVSKYSDKIVRNFINIFQCSEESIRFKLLDLNQIKSDDELKDITKLKLTNKLHFDYLFKPTENNYKLKYYFEAYHLIEKF